MKKTLYLLLLIILPSFIYSQNSWIFDDYENRETDSEYIVDVKQMGDDKLISLSRNFFPGPFNHIIRIHDLQNGSELLKNTYTSDSTALAFVYSNEEAEEIYLFGASRKGFLLLTKWDYNLNLLDSTKYYLPKNRYITNISANRFDDEYVFRCVTYSNTQNSQEQTYFISLDLKGNLKIMKKLDIQGGVDNIVKKIDGKGYWGIGDIYYSFDNNLNVESENFELLDHQGGGISWRGKIFDDSTYILGIPYDDGYTYGTRIAKANLDMTIRKQTPFQYEGNYTTLRQKGFDFYYKDALYLAAMDYWDLTYFDISKFDSDLNLLWRKHIRLNENDTYYMFSLEATSDGGAVICGNKKRYNMEGKRDSSRAFILKIAGDGTIVSNNELDETGWEVTVFPNPSQGDFKIEIAGDANNTILKLFDLQGRKVKVYNNLISGSNHVNMHNLPEGIYVWKLEKEGKIIGSGKWVKE